MSNPAAQPYEPPAAQGDPPQGEDEPGRLQVRRVLLGVLVSFMAELVITATAAGAYIGMVHTELLRDPELVLWRVMDSPFLRMVGAMSGLPATMLGGFVAARGARARPRAHAVAVAVSYAALLTLVAELLLTTSDSEGAEHLTYAATVSGTLVGGFLGGLFAARGRPG